MCCVPRAPFPRRPLPPGRRAVTSMAAGLAAAFAGAVALDASYLLQHAGTRDRPALDLRRPRRSAAVLLGSPRWLAGLAAGMAGVAGLAPPPPPGPVSPPPGPPP